MTQLIKTEQSMISVVNDEDFTSLASGGASFLPRIQIMQASAEKVKEGKVAMGVFAFFEGTDTIIDLGKVFVAVPVAYRSKAMDFSADTPLAFHDAKSEQFASIRKRADAKEQGCAYGIEWLLWVPELNKFATFFCGSPTTRPLSRDIKVLLGKAAQFKTDYIKSKANGFSWFGFKVFNSVEEVFTLPSDDELKVTSETFLNPKDSEVEAADESTDSEERDR